MVRFLIAFAVVATLAGSAAAKVWPTPAAGESSSGGPEIVFTFDDGPNPTLTPKVLDILKKNNLLTTVTSSRVIIQSFDDTTVKLLAKDLPQVPRVFLVDPANAPRIDSEEKVKQIAAWATGLGPNKMIVAARPELVTWAHAAGLTVTPWTFRSSNTGTFASVREEMTKFLYEYGVDAVFTDNPDQFPRK